MPAYVADVPGRATAMLVFRVGYADAPLRDHGLTDLVEHLVTPRYGPRDGVGGIVMACATVIGVEGRPEEVGGKLGGFRERAGG